MIRNSWKGIPWTLFFGWTIFGWSVTSDYCSSVDQNLFAGLGLALLWILWLCGLIIILRLLKKEF